MPPSTTIDWPVMSSAVQIDVRDLGSIEGAVTRTLERYGRIHVLVNNAGGGHEPRRPRGHRGRLGRGARRQPRGPGVQGNARPADASLAEVLVHQNQAASSSILRAH